MDTAIEYIGMIYNNPKKWTINTENNTPKEVTPVPTTTPAPVPTLTVAKIESSKEKIKGQFPRNDSIQYSNIRWSNILGGTTNNDTTNPNLLNDLNNAAKSINVIITITTAKEGHARKVKGTNIDSRHYRNVAVDIAIINNKSVLVQKGNRNFSGTDADRLVEVLMKMGYSYNVESGKSKAILWRTSGHWNHVHVSNEIK